MNRSLLFIDLICEGLAVRRDPSESTAVFDVRDTRVYGGYDMT